MMNEINESVFDRINDLIKELAACNDPKPEIQNLVTSLQNIKESLGAIYTTASESERFKRRNDIKLLTDIDTDSISQTGSISITHQQTTTECEAGKSVDESARTVDESFYQDHFEEKKQRNGKKKKITLKRIREVIKKPFRKSGKKKEKDKSMTSKSHNKDNSAEEKKGKIRLGFRRSFRRSKKSFRRSAKYRKDRLLTLSQEQHDDQVNQPAANQNNMQEHGNSFAETPELRVIYDEVKKISEFLKNKYHFPYQDDAIVLPDDSDSPFTRGLDPSFRHVVSRKQHQFQNRFGRIGRESAQEFLARIFTDEAIAQNKLNRSKLCLHNFDNLCEAFIRVETALPRIKTSIVVENLKEIRQYEVARYITNSISEDLDHVE